ncbi:MAG: ATP-binding cassette domain-containing protein [Alicyclobacillus sp.]|nr:ATP-binding cassette domain-containing protein [Alicyclobacillus sp.]
MMTEPIRQPAAVPLVRLEHVTKSFRTARGQLIACNDINLEVKRGISLGLVGESGSGKSTLIKTIQLLERPTAGTVWIEGQNVTHASERKLKPLRRKIQFVAQDPLSSLFPNMTVGQNIAEPMFIHAVGDKKARQERAIELMERVGLSLAYYHSFPHELSGGQQQRVAIARALALNPEILVLDEAVSSLDVSIQAQILNLLQRLKEELNLTYIFISHNLAVIRLMCEETAVMYLGRIVEQGETDALFKQPLHPYTRSLIACIPAFTAEGVTPLPDASMLTGERPSPTNLPSGCAYHMRCAFATDKCRSEVPPLQPVSVNRSPLGRTAACHYAETFAANS